MTEAEKQRLCMQTGERIRRFREEMGLTKEQLAEAANISTQYINDIELGRKCMSFSIFADIARALHTDMDTLAHGWRRDDPGVSRAADYLLDLRPVERELAAKMLVDAAKAAMALGEERQVGDL